MKTSDFDYRLPPDRIAQVPIEPRDASRLMVLDRHSGEVTHSQFSSLGEFLNPGDLLVVNQTRVIPARLYARKVPTGGQVELLLLNKRAGATWEALAGGKRLLPGARLQLENGLGAEIVAVLDGAKKLIRFECEIEPFLPELGHVPLPPYIRESLDDPQRYQTVYAKEPGSAAAPTAGLHFTPARIAALEAGGIRFASLTLHVGLDTFAPVNEADPQSHRIHSEWCRLPAETARAINEAKSGGGRVVAVGTTSVRVLETAARQTRTGGQVAPWEGPTDLFILPGFEFRLVDALLTNFHLPRSTLIMLVSAFAGRESILAAYELAIQEGYRFYSFGDAMLIH